MSHNQTKSRSIGWLAILFGCHIGILTLATGCSRVPENRASEKPRNQNSSAKSALSPLILEGHELHESLTTREIGSVQDLPTGLVSPGNPHLSNEDAFVLAVARGGSQGQLGQKGIRSALFARYTTGKNELGFYGLEAESESDADDREKAARSIWAHNGSFGRSRVHRKGLVVLVIWHNEVSPECWKAVNATVMEKLNISKVEEAEIAF